MKNAEPKTPNASRNASKDWSVGAFMTPQPVTIGRKQPLAIAHRMMRAHGVRHLPVLEHGELVGVVSQRDLYFLETVRGADPEEDSVEDAMSTDAYAVTADLPVATVAKHMARKRYGCAVVMERDRVAGIFTTTDALHLLGEVGRARRAP